MQNFLTRNKKKLLVFAVLLLVVLISYGQTLFMYFWQDDSALIFRLQHPAGQMGSFGPSIWADRGPYRYMVIPFVPFFKLFNLEPFGYFLGGLVTYLIATIVFYVFTNELFKNKKVSLASSLIFAAGYIGSDMMFRIINSWQSNVGLILSLLSLLFYLKFLREDKIKYLFFAVLSYVGAIELVYIRSHGLIASIIILDFVFKLIPTIKKEKIKAFIKSAIRIAPFLVLFYFWYLRDTSFGTPGLLSLVKEIFTGNLGMLMPLFATIGNALVPSIISEKLVLMFGSNAVLLITSIMVFVFFVLVRVLAKKKLILFLNIFGDFVLFFASYILYEQKLFWYSDLNSFISGTIGLILTFNIFYIGVLTWKSKGDIGKILIASYIMMVTQIFSYYVQYPTAVFTTTHRYLAFALIGYSILGSTLLYLLGLTVLPKVKFYLLVSLLVGLNLFLGVRYQSDLVKVRSVPSRAFYQSLLKEIPKIEKGSIFYFNVEDNAFIRKQFNDFFSVGSMPESTALAIYYGVDRDDVLFLMNFDELVSILAEDPQRINKVYSIYYGNEGLINETDSLRKLLVEQNTTSAASVIRESNQKSVINSQASIPSSTYLAINFLAKVDVSSTRLNSIKKTDISNSERDLVFSYLGSKKEFYNSSSIGSLSEWRYQEIENLLDGNTDTSWRGHRIYWDNNEREEVILDLGYMKEVSRYIWTNWITSLSPTAYTIETSSDGKNWTVVSRVKAGPAKKISEKTIEEFTPTRARYIKMNIESTQTNDAPAMTEVEAVESKYDNLELWVVDEFLSSPFSYASSLNQAYAFSQTFANVSYINVVLETDKGKTKTIIPVGQFNTQSLYKVYFPQSGTSFKSVVVEIANPLEINISSASIKNLNIKDMENLNLIKSFSQN